VVSRSKCVSRVLGKKYVCKWEELTAGCRKMHNQELQDLYCVSNFNGGGGWAR
jgi:hypothetical protein